MARKSYKKHVFILNNIDIEKLDQKYGLSSINIEVENIPVNTTKINDLEVATAKNLSSITFLDETKKPRKCYISLIDFQSQKNLSDFKGEIKYKCFWDKNFINKDIQPLGCPIKYVPNKAIKSYHSEISKEKYVISETISSERYNLITNENDHKIHLEKRDFYYTDGIFCSFNCCLAYINENKKDPFYKYSESLLLKIYNEVNNDCNEDILPAPHWRALIDFGGHLTINQFRESFNRIKYHNHGIYYVSIGNLFEDDIKF